MPNLGGDELQPLAVEGAAQGSVDGAGPIPTHLDDPRLEARARESRAQSLGRGGGVEYDVSVTGCIIGTCERCAQVLGKGAAAGIEIDQRDLRSWNARRKMGGEQTDHAPSHYDDPIAWSAAAVPDRVQGRLEISGKNGAPRRNALRHGSRKA